MMQEGDGKLRLLADQTLWLRATAPFHVLETDKEGTPLRVLGPNSVEDRRYKIQVRELTYVEVKTQGAWSYDLRTFPRCEITDPTPMEIPLGMTKPETLEEIMARMIKSRFEIMAADNGYETEDEANDFEVGNEDDWKSPYELQEMQEDTPFFEEAEPPGAPAPSGTPPAEQSEAGPESPPEGESQPVQQ